MYFVKMTGCLLAPVRSDSAFKSEGSSKRLNDLTQVPSERGWDKGRFWKDRLVPLMVLPFREHMPYIRCVCVNVALCRYELKLLGKKPDLSERFYKADDN